MHFSDFEWNLNILDQKQKLSDKNDTFSIEREIGILRLISQINPFLLKKKLFSRDENSLKRPIVRPFFDQGYVIIRCGLNFFLIF